MTLKIEAAGGVGAYVKNVDLGELDKASVKQLRSGLGEYGVLFFRNQSLSPEQHIKMAEAGSYVGQCIHYFFQ